RGLGAVPRLGGLYLARRDQGRHRAGQLSRLRLRDPLANHLGQKQLRLDRQSLECMRRPIENNASPGQAVYEPFSGSGTTIIAAEMTGRACHAIEIAPAYVDVAVKRWQ